MSDATLSRRRFVGLAAGAGGVAVAGGAAYLVTRDDEPTGSPTAGAPAAEPGSAEAVGERYLEEVPAEADRARLLEELPRGVEEALTEPPDEAAAGRLAAAVREDFTEGRTIELDGWVLSVTECRAAALLVV